MAENDEKIATGDDDGGSTEKKKAQFARAQAKGFSTYSITEENRLRDRIRKLEQDLNMARQFNQNETSSLRADLSTAKKTEQRLREQLKQEESKNEELRKRIDELTVKLANSSKNDHDS